MEAISEQEQDEDEENDEEEEADDGDEQDATSSEDEDGGEPEAVCAVLACAEVYVCTCGMSMVGLHLFLLNFSLPCFFLPKNFFVKEKNALFLFDDSFSLMVCIHKEKVHFFSIIPCSLCFAWKKEESSDDEVIDDKAPRKRKRAAAASDNRPKKKPVSCVMSNVLCNLVVMSFCSTLFFLPFE